GHGDTEIVDTEEAVKLFTLDGIGKSPSRMDFAKLAHVNAHYMRQADEDRLMNLTMRYITENLGADPDAAGVARFKSGLHALKERASTLIELADAGMFFVRPRPLPLTEDAAKVLDADTRAMLAEVSQTLASLDDFKAEKIETALKEYGTQKGLKLGKVAMPLRAAITGTTNSPSIFHVAEILGKEETLARLSDVKA
ncbi:MAG: glutamate--tRNA ligase, partial [Bdellovibrionales bacterium]|nr:glutamate--tRNA ligase [Bdellovibrionales bacterium]